MVDAGDAGDDGTGPGSAPRLDRGKQDKHIAGSNNYIPGRSILTDRTRRRCWTWRPAPGNR